MIKSIKHIDSLRDGGSHVYKVTNHFNITRLYVRDYSLKSKEAGCAGNFFGASYEKNTFCWGGPVDPEKNEELKAAVERLGNADYMTF